MNVWSIPKSTCMCGPILFSGGCEGKDYRSSLLESISDYQSCEIAVGSISNHLGISTPMP